MYAAKVSLCKYMTKSSIKIVVYYEYSTLIGWVRKIYFTPSARFMRKQ